MWITAGGVFLALLICFVSVCFGKHRPKKWKKKAKVEPIKTQISEPVLSNMPPGMPVPRFNTVKPQLRSKIDLSPPPQSQETDIDQTVYINDSLNFSSGKPKVVEYSPKFGTFIEESNEETYFTLRKPNQIEVVAVVEEPVYDCVPSVEEPIYDDVPVFVECDVSFPAPPPNI